MEQLTFVGRTDKFKQIYVEVLLGKYGTVESASVYRDTFNISDDRRLNELQAVSGWKAGINLIFLKAEDPYAVFRYVLENYNIMEDDQETLARLGLV